MGTVRILSALLILFGAGVEAPECASTCGDPVSTGRWIVGLSLIIFVLPIVVSTPGRRRARPLRSPVTMRRRGAALLSRLLG